MVFGWLLGRPPLATFSFNMQDALLGVVATVPLLFVFWMCLVTPWRPFQTITQILDEMLVPLFRECGVVQFLIIATLAGVGEEMFFRGIKGVRTIYLLQARRETANLSPCLAPCDRLTMDWCIM